MQWLAGADVISEPFYDRTKRPAMDEPTPSSSPVCFVSEDSSGAVIVDESDLAALINIHTGVALGNLIKEDPAAMVSDDPYHLVDLIGSLLLQGELIFFRHGSPYRAMPVR